MPDNPDNKARGGLFGGAVDQTTPAITPAAQPSGETTSRSQGGFFGGGASTAAAPSGGTAPSGSSSTEAEGGLFSGPATGGTTDGQGGTSSDEGGTTSDVALGSLFDGAGSSVIVREGPRGPEGPPGMNGMDGTVVTANPPGDDGDDLTRIRIGEANYNIAGGGADDDRTDLERFRAKITLADTERRPVFVDGLPQTFTFDIDGEVGNVLGTYTFVDGLPERIVYTGALVDSITGFTGGEFIKRFIFSGGLPSRIFWEEITGALLTLTDDGWLSDSTGTATLTDDGWFTAMGWELTDDGYLMEAN